MCIEDERSIKYGFRQYNNILELRSDKVMDGDRVTNKDMRIKVLQGKIMRAENRGNGAAGVVRKWSREIRNLSK